MAVLWLSAALAAIAFSLASTVRGEVERTSTAIDGARGYYLATGALERAMLYLQWGPRFPLGDGSSRYYSPWTTRLHFSFPTGEADVDIVPESARLNLNYSPPEDLLRLLVAAGVEPDRATLITRAIVDWRTPPPEGALTEFDRYYLSLNPSFPSRHASFRETEELLLVRGMTPEIFHGSFQRDSEGVLRPLGGLADYVTVYGDGSAVDVNTAPLPVLAAIGLDANAVDMLAQARSRQPLRSLDVLRAMGLPPHLLGRLGIGGNSMYTLRATARWRTPDGKLSDAVRTVAATVNYGGAGAEAAFRVLRWHDHVWARDLP